ncbi:hypothetical protein RMATCC62417_09155 [Rhizopus microsporus]|nr:hypothetical protein RMATCC62417_09155 [Rhizopus microsporus]
MADNVVLQFTVLFTAQKAKKFKTWQDGTMKYYGSNKKLVLIDDKGYNIDRKFYKGNIPSVGDEIEFDGHIVTVEACDDPAHSPSTTPVAVAPQPVSAPFKKPSLKSVLMARRNIPNTATTSPESGYTPSPSEADPATIASVSSATTTIPSSDSPVKPFTSPLKRKQRLVNVDPEELEDAMDIDESPVSTVEAALGQPSTSNENPTVNNLQQQPKRARFGLSRPSSSTVNNVIKKSNTSTDQFIGSFTKASNISETTELPIESSNSTVNKPFKTPFVEGVYTTATLQFPSSRKALAVLKSRKYPKRSKVVPTKFPNVNVYRDTFKKIIYEHLEILLLNYGLYFYSIYEKYANGKQGNELERTIRAKGLGMYVDCEIKGDTRYQDSTRYRLVLRNKEHHSKYSKDDIWIISKVSTFDPSQTFLARSIFYGPFSDGTLEVDCVSPRDARIANKIVSETRYIYALRSISASTEFMMLDTLEEKLDNLPLLPYILGDRQGRKKKDLLPSAPLPTLAHIELRRDDCIDVNARLAETVARYRLNADQESVLRQIAASVITCPGWSEESQHPVVLVHGVYGSGKSFLAAVIILFIQELLDAVNGHREPEDQVQFKILVSSMTNVAVDRILQTLLKLGYDHFVRIGSMKKIAKNILPYTAKARLSSNEELKELEQMLDDGQNSEEDLENIATAIQRFRKSEGISQIHTAPVVGTTFMSSVFDIFNGVSFPFILIDESSQLMEPLTMVPLARFSCHRLLMVGDPLQLPPTLVSPAEEGKIGKGLDKTLFDRFIEVYK